MSRCVDKQKTFEDVENLHFCCNFGRLVPKRLSESNRLSGKRLPKVGPCYILWQKAVSKI